MGCEWLSTEKIAYGYCVGCMVVWTFFEEQLSLKMISCMRRVTTWLIKSNRTMDRVSEYGISSYWWMKTYTGHE